eukprot:19152-Heterococcus_DN1.PRE.1
MKRSSDQEAADAPVKHSKTAAATPAADSEPVEPGGPGAEKFEVRAYIESRRPVVEANMQRVRQAAARAKLALDLANHLTPHDDHRAQQCLLHSAKYDLHSTGCVSSANPDALLNCCHRFDCYSERAIFALLLDAAKANNGRTVIRIAGGWVRDKLLGRDSDDIDVALDNISGNTFAKHTCTVGSHTEAFSLAAAMLHSGRTRSTHIVNAELKAKGHPTSGIGVIQANPDQSKHLETATVKVLGAWLDFVNLRTETYSQDSRIPELQQYCQQLLDGEYRILNQTMLQMLVQRQQRVWHTRGWLHTCNPMMPLTEVLLPLLCLPRRPGRIDDRFAALHCGVHTHVRKGLHGVNNRNVVYCAGHYMRALHQSVYCDAGSRFCVSAATCTAHISHMYVLMNKSS